MLWLRAEERSNEHRTPLAPADAARLVASGMDVVVEESPHRVHSVEAYRSAGCEIVKGGQWPYAPSDAYILGLKELPATGEPLCHRHIYFGHCYKAQPGAGELLRRFAEGGGELLDLEYLTDVGGRRLVAFGYWAGYVGAALAVLHDSQALRAPLQPVSKQELDERLARTRKTSKKALVIGALGRCGSGARDALAQAGREVTAWDLAETRKLDHTALTAHDPLVNAVLTNGPAKPFVTDAEVADPRRRLTTIVDVTCDVGSPGHTLPIYRTTTTWAEPVRRITTEPAPLDVIAIDNLPSLLPREASDAFSADLAPLLVTLEHPDSPWVACRRRFRKAANPGGTP
jgi:saccharopine dehydrogenase (NAD+, L-lysine-forming)